MTAAHEDPVDAEVVEEPGAQVVQLHKAPRPAPVPLTVDRTSSKARAVVARVAERGLPSRHQVVVSTGWWARTLAQAAPQMPVLLVKELAPILRGVGRVASWWAQLVAVAHLFEAAKEAEGNKRAEHTKAAHKAKTSRTVISGVLFLVLVGVTWWQVVVHPWGVAAVGLVVVVVLDFIGRQGRETAPFLPPVAMPSVLSANVPLGQITASILGALEREGFPEGSVAVAEPLWWDETRRQYEMSLSLADQLKPEHLRAIERAIGAKDYAVRNLATGTATVRHLIISIGDPLAGGQECEWIPGGALSFTDPLPLGRSAGETPMAVRFVGAHTGIVGRTRAGKTEGLLWTLIDRLSACCDVVTWGIDLQAGPAFPLWRKVIQRVAYDEDDALDLLEAAIAEMKRRKKILTELAESDDADHEDAGTVWTADLGAYLVIVVDEFALTATYNGEKGKANLLGPLEEIARTGLKFGVHLVLATQKTGNSDFGSSVMQTQLGIRILLACKEEDTVRMLSTEHRDSGYAPHLLQPAQGDVPNDAGKCYIDGPDHRTPDVYRSDYWPRGSIKARARRRLADGLPTLDGRRHDAIDAVEVPPIPAAVARAFAECDAEKLPTTVLIGFLAKAGIEVTDQQLSDAMKINGERIGDRWREVPGGPQVRGYTRDAVEKYLRSLG